MDAKASSDRPLNRRASKLLCRPDTHGTILVMKTTFIKSHADAKGRSEDILGWEKVTEEELKSDEFKRKRAEWSKYRERGRLAAFAHSYGLGRDLDYF